MHQTMSPHEVQVNQFPAVTDRRVSYEPADPGAEMAPL